MTNLENYGLSSVNIVPNRYGISNKPSSIEFEFIDPIDLISLKKISEDYGDFMETRHEIKSHEDYVSGDATIYSKNIGLFSLLTGGKRNKKIASVSQNLVSVDYDERQLIINYGKEVLDWNPEEEVLKLIFEPGYHDKIVAVNS